MSETIIRLPEHVINQIKAGEVVERPISVVKELVENSLDAGAESVVVDLLDGGKQLIRVVDDGRGMSPGDLSLALERHATSKLRTVDDMDRIATLGFRGEALPSIAAVSRFTMRSSRGEGPLGFQIEMCDGSKTEVEEVSMSRGTVVETRDLFFNIPARGKFLKRTATEYSHIHEFLEAMSLAYYRIGWKLTHNGRDVFSYRAAGSLAERLRAVAGRECEALVEVSARRGSFSVQGFVSVPDGARPVPRRFITFVNGRWVRDRVVRSGILQGFGGLIPRGVVPEAMVFLSLSSEHVDVNAHPAKTELRFHDSLAVQDFVSQAVQSAVREKMRETSAPKSSQTSRAEWVATEDSVRASLPRPPSEPNPFLGSSSRSAATWQSAARQESGRVFPVSPEPRPTPAPSPVIFETIPKRGPFAGAKYLGQYAGCFLLVEAERELWVIDQHAFHERILFEELTRAFETAGGVPQQELLVPILVPFPLSLSGVVTDDSDLLRHLGFSVEVLRDEGLAVHAIPALLDAGRATSVLEEILARLVALAGLSVGEIHPLTRRAAELHPDLGDLAAARAAGDLSRTAVFQHFFATIACHGAVRAGERLADEQSRRLLERAGDVDFFANCPHGRPVVRRFAEADVAAWFMRV